MNRPRAAVNFLAGAIDMLTMKKFAVQGKYVDLKRTLCERKDAK